MLCSINKFKTMHTQFKLFNYLIVSIKSMIYQLKILRKLILGILYT